MTVVSEEWAQLEDKSKWQTMADAPQGRNHRSAGKGE
jgi:hypothetical protein